jgi:hypothetical protein
VLLKAHPVDGLERFAVKVSFKVGFKLLLEVVAQDSAQVGCVWHTSDHGVEGTIKLVSEVLSFPEPLREQ